MLHCKEKLCAGDFKSEVTKKHKAQKLHFIYAHDPLSSSRERKRQAKVCLVIQPSVADRSRRYVRKDTLKRH